MKADSDRRNGLNSYGLWFVTSSHTWMTKVLQHLGQVFYNDTLTLFDVVKSRSVIQRSRSRWNFPVKLHFPGTCATLVTDSWSASDSNDTKMILKSSHENLTKVVQKSSSGGKQQWKRKCCVSRAGSETPDKEKRSLAHTVKSEHFIQSGFDILFYLLVRNCENRVKQGETEPFVLIKAD